MFETLAGVKIHTDSLLVDHHSMQFRYPKSKKKRIRQKFAKKYMRRWTTPKDEMYQIVSPFNGEIFWTCHPDTLEKLKRQLAEVKL